MSERRQFIEIDGVKSELTIIPFGVPQGSILGPLLYIIATCDIQLWISDKNIDSFADDTYNTLACETENDLIKKIEVIAREMESFLLSNGLK